MGSALCELLLILCPYGAEPQPYQRGDKVFHANPFWHVKKK
jgi:hypothetical protein